MSDSNEITNELQEMQSPLANMPRHMPYAVPAGYWENQATASTQLSAHIPTPFSVPANYFADMTARVVTAAKAQDTPARKIPVSPRIQWLQAAALALIITAGSYIMFSGKANEPEQMLAKVSKTEIQEYIDNTTTEPEVLIADESLAALQIDSKQITAYLDETGWE